VAYSSETTLKRPVTIKGTGLHTGACVGVSLEPAPPRSGITFALGSERFTLREATVRSTELCVGIAKGKKEVKTVEHLLSAIFGIGLTNVTVRVQGPEIPILDGSALPFFDGTRACRPGSAACEKAGGRGVEAGRCHARRSLGEFMAKSGGRSQDASN